MRKKMQAVTKYKRWLMVGIFLLTGCGRGGAPGTALPGTALPPSPTAEPATLSGAPASAPATAVPTKTAAPAIPLPTALPTAETVAGEHSISDPYAPELGNTGYDVLRYTIQLTLDPVQAYYLDGVVLIEALAVEDGLSRFSLDFIGFEIEQLLVNEQPAAFSREEGKVFITLPEPLAAEEPFQIAVAYQGEVVQQSSPYVGFASWLGPFYARDHTIYILSEPDGSRYWFPNNDHPRDKAHFRFEITVPAGLTAVANGELVDIQNNTFIWEHEYPMASYLATIAVGFYDRLDGQSPAGIPLRHYVFPGSRDRFEAATHMTGAAIDWMSDLFGAYPYETYGYVTVHAPGVSLETQTMVLLSTDMLNENTVIHELAHMWFGNWVSLDSWGEMWRNEGFATYISFLWEFRDDPEGLALQMEGIRAFLEDSGNLGKPLRNPAPPELFSAHTYVGGALMVHDLRQEMGDEAFFTGLQNYFAQYGGGTASDEQFVAVMEAAAGKQLDAFFAEWLGL